MQCPNCGLVVRGLPGVFTKPIRCPDCNVKGLFKPVSVAKKSKAVAEKPVWKKLLFVLGVVLSVAIVLTLAALAYFRHPSPSSNPGGVETKPRPTEPTETEEKTNDENPAEEPAAEAVP
jgi:hypothetical protein